MKQSFYALCYLHKNRICHRDIKPENFLLYKEDDDTHIKLIDFGLAKRVEPNEIMNKPNGTPYYIAPEVLKGSYTTQCDIWSMGVIMYIMLCGKPPFGGKQNKDIINNVLNSTYSMKNEVWNSISNDAKDMISKLLQRGNKFLNVFLHIFSVMVLFNKLITYQIKRVDFALSKCI